MEEGYMKLVLILCTIIILCLGAIIGLTVYDTNTSCHKLYAEARTHADTMVVDASRTNLYGSVCLTVRKKAL
jgi:hypothetical protein